MAIVEVRAVAVEPADEADGRLRARSLSAYRYADLLEPPTTMNCSSCEDMNRERRIRSPKDLREAIQFLQAKIAGGTLKEIPVGSSPFALTKWTSISVVEPNGPWNDIVYYEFCCRSCGTRFCLSAETYHGMGGWLTPLKTGETA